MAFSILNSGTQNSVAASTANYNRMCANGCNQIASESTAQVKWHDTGRLSNAFLYISANTVTATSTLVSRKGAATQNLSISVGDSATGWFFDDVNTDVTASGDLWAWLLTTGASGTSLNPRNFGCKYLYPTGGVAAVYGTAGAHAAQSTASTTYYVAWNGNLSAPSTTESTHVTKPQSDVTFNRLVCNITTNGRSTATVYRFRNNGANGNMTFSTTASTTGWYQDTAHSDTVTAGNTACISFTLGTGTGSVGGWPNVWTLSTAQSCDMLGGSGAVSAFGTTSGYIGMFNNGTKQGTESNPQMDMRQSGVYSNLSVNFNTNTRNVVVGIRLRKNSGDGNNTVTIAASTTGWVTDASNTDTFVSGDLLCLKVDNDNAGTGGWTIYPHSQKLSLTGNKTKNGLAMSSLKTSNGATYAVMHTANGTL